MAKKEPHNTPTYGWSTALFLKINGTVGNHPWRDRIMTFCADKLVYVLVLLSLLWVVTDLVSRDPLLVTTYLKLMITAFAFGIGLSWTIGYLLPNPRPIRTLPVVHQLVRPMGTWKSFPSDHTIGSFTVATVTVLFGIPLWFAVLLYLVALCISLSRIYVGVHYPRDILGGVVIGVVISLLAPWLLDMITNPIYLSIKTLFV